MRDYATDQYDSDPESPAEDLQSPAVKSRTLENPQGLTFHEWLDASEPAQRHADMPSLWQAWKAGEDPTEWRAWVETLEKENLELGRNPANGFPHS